MSRPKKLPLELLPLSTQRLDAVITDLGISRSEFGQSIGLSASAMGHIFSRRQTVPTLWALAIEARYQISSDWLLEGKGPKAKFYKLTELQHVM